MGPIMTGTRTCIFVMFLLLLFTGAHAAESAVSSRTYSVGIVPQFDARRTYNIWRHILDKIQQATGLRFVLKGSPNIPAFEQAYMSGAFDFAYMNPYHALLANHSQGYVPLVRDVGRRLQGILVVKRNSQIHSVTALAGKTIAFPSPNSLGATLLIRAELKDKYNIQLIPKYVRSHSSVYLNVALGQFAAGGGVQKTLQQQAPNLRGKLRVLYRTAQIVPHPFTAHPRVPIQVQQQVRQAFIALGQSTSGRQLLLQVPIQKIGRASMQDYESLSKYRLDRFYQKD